MPSPRLPNLPLAKPREFVPPHSSAGDWPQVEPLFLKLADEVPRLKNSKALVRWLLQASELASFLMEEEARCYIRMTCQTDDPDAERAYLHYIEQVEPRAKSHWHRLQKLYLDCPQRRKLPRSRWLVHDRETLKDVEIFREKNIPLQTQESKLEQRYQKRMAAMTIAFRGQELTLQQAGRYLDENEREVREEVWRRIAARRLQDRAELDRNYEDLLALRHRIARNAGLPSFREYTFKARSRFDYTPRDCEAFHEAVAECVVPLARELQARRARLLGVPRLRPWDLNVDPRGRPPLRPFSGVPVLVEKTQEVFRRVDPSLSRDFARLRSFGLLDLESRKGKAPGGYQHTLEEARLPFIFMNAVGLQRDVETLLHEGGHAFHTLAVRDEPLVLYRHAPLEFCEVASMTMELLAAPHFDVFYTKPDAARARRTHLEGVVYLLCWIAVIDSFQHWVYTHPRHTPAQRAKEWVRLLERFGGDEDWSGLDAERAHLWHRQPHLFTSPFYYIEYGIAQLGALQVWQRAQRDLDRAVRAYRRALALGRSVPLPELFRAAGIRFDFSARIVKPLVTRVQRELATLEQA